MNIEEQIKEISILKDFVKFTKKQGKKLNTLSEIYLRETLDMSFADFLEKRNPEYNRRDATKRIIRTPLLVNIKVTPDLRFSYDGEGKTEIEWEELEKNMVALNFKDKRHVGKDGQVHFYVWRGNKAVVYDAQIL